MPFTRTRLILATALSSAFLASGVTAIAVQPSGAAGTAPSAPSAFQHPGVLVDRDGLDFARRQVQAGAQPWKTAFDTMNASRYASLSWKPRPRETVECGPRSTPNHGCSDERDDALAAYTHALLWTVTGEQRHARKAIEILDAWSGTIKRHTNSNAPLQTGWAGASFSRAAEIVRHTGAGWSSARVSRVEKVLREVYLPTVIKGAPNQNGNWELIMTDAAIGIAVFLDDRASFDRAVRTWRGRLPAYIYLRSDGELPKSPPGSTKDTREELIKYWHGQSTLRDGLTQETCRDFGHTGWGLAAAAHTAETARLQGVDLYREGRTRLIKAMEFHADLDLGTQPPSWLCGGAVKKGLGPTQEVVLNHYGNRLGVAMPHTKRLATNRRPAGADYFLAWETLTHVEKP
ncbi:hypothetical protein F7R91_33210 [Streptomyces luteolifulvus]|uniref:Alginate lyase domain-containing protein n=1 Tax=Streptomyces luteolifulvus TaxID=2615112 RepID=A0A6H9UR19_9ACTN|nr:alginate lyase family protein [Streptomyces luteolifulvus]KAB1141281.1 hypothetical protein F7R91_33210 [Streptomyces luteolifulvus]